MGGRGHQGKVDSRPRKMYSFRTRLLKIQSIHYVVLAFGSIRFDTLLLACRSVLPAVLFCRSSKTSRLDFGLQAHQRQLDDVLRRRLPSIEVVNNLLAPRGKKSCNNGQRAIMTWRPVDDAPS